MMRFKWAKTMLVAVVAASIFAPVSNAMAQSTDVLVDINLKDADMIAATRMLTQRTGLQFVIEPSDQPYGKITLKLEGRSADEIIRYICQAAGAYFRRDEKGVFIISRTKPVETVAPTAPAVTPVLPKITRKMKILKADARTVHEQIRYGNALETTASLDTLREFTRRVTGVGQQFPEYKADSFQSRNQQFYPAGSRQIQMPMSARESGNSIVLPDEDANQLGGRGGQGGGIGGQGGGLGGQGGGGFGGQGGGGLGQGQGQTNLTGGQGLVPAGIDFISFDPADNSLVVRGTEDAINELQQQISLFDVAPRQVTIKVEFITTTGTLDRSLGFDWLYQRGSVIAGNRPGSFARSGDPIFINYATGNITTRLRTFLSEGNGRVVTSPIVRTLNNTPAIVFNTVTTTVFINNATITNGGTVVNTPTPLQLTASTVLSVTPRINEDNTITVGLAPTVQNFVGTSIGPDGQEIPNQVAQGLAVVARVKNGETIVLGGMTSKSDDVSVNRIPVLSELPVIGQFFRGQRRSRTTSELLIFVTPQILDDEDGGIG